mmetsp:Transcript_57171/g.63877  ORF Transcript_57171/g.63877 Transcript_57171/m.63877 type:complete len:240 (+) Transcript_57171:85-804(+)
MNFSLAFIISASSLSSSSSYLGKYDGIASRKHWRYAITSTRHLSFLSTLSMPTMPITLGPTTLCFQNNIDNDRIRKGSKIRNKIMHNNNNRLLFYHDHRHHYRVYYATSSSILMLAKPKKMGSVVDNYQTVSVNCNKCKLRLFRYKKKNGTKSNLIKCYIERICEDSAGILSKAQEQQHQDSSINSNGNNNNNKSSCLINNLSKSWTCPKCDTKFARSSVIHGRPALKMIGGKIRMTKK